MPKTPKKKKKSPHEKLWDLAYTTFREYIRQRDTNFQGYATDPSDGKIYEAKDCDIGHFRHGKGKECYFWETNVHLQAKKNNYFGGQTVLQRYTAFIIGKYGMEEFERIDKAKRISWTNERLNKVIQDYKEKMSLISK